MDGVTTAKSVLSEIAGRLSDAGIDQSVELDVQPMSSDEFPQFDESDCVWLEQITSVTPRRGTGRAAMAELCMLADENDCRIALNPWAQNLPGALRQDELESFYSSLGFGWRDSHVMVREPWAQTTVHVQHDVPWQPTPNRCETILSDTAPRSDLTSTAFAVPVDETGSALMTMSRKPGRGLEIAGGHIEPGEDGETATRREVREETGARMGELHPIGHQRLISMGIRPDGWRYPFPLAYQSFFAADLIAVHGTVDDEESGPPVLVSDPDVLNAQTRLLVLRARTLVRTKRRDAEEPKQDG